MIVHECDRCHKRIDPTAIAEATMAQVPCVTVTVSPIGKNQTRTAELCQKCSESMTKWFANPKER